MSARRRARALATLAASLCAASAWAAEAGRVLGPASCAQTQCHDLQNRWWFGDPHYETIRPFYEGQPRYRDIAQRYGLSLAEATRGGSRCMDCHGTVVGAAARDEVRAGVSCESCHGAAERWLPVHREGDVQRGRDRSGYRAALAAGMRDVRRLEVTADTCVGCHYIREPALRRTGHPDGAAWDLAAQLERVDHWDEPLAAYDVRNAAIRAARARRGALEPVDVPLLATTSAVRVEPTTRRRFVRQRKPSVFRGAAMIAKLKLDLGPAPAPTPDAAIAERLAVVQRQLELIARKAAEQGGR
jgi:hypothetical protein